MTGRKPRTISMMLQPGTAGAVASHDDTLPEDPELLVCPPELGPVAQKEWDRLVPELTALDRFTKLDRGTLAIYCGAYALWADAIEAIQKFGSMVKSPTGFPIQSPYVAIANRQAEIMIRIAAEFGFTPASRRRTITSTFEEFPFS